MGEWKVGKKIYPNFLLPVYCKENEKFEEAFGKECLQLVLIKQGTIAIEINGISRVASAPCILCLNSKDRVKVISRNTFESDSVFFLPETVNNSLSMDTIYDTDNHGQGMTSSFQDRFFFKAFIERSDTYTGSINIDHFSMQLLCQKFSKLQSEVSVEKDYFWPCRSRSILIEMLIAVQEKYSDPCKRDTDIPLSTESTQAGEILDFLHTNYMNRITIADLTKQFPLNRNKLNRHFTELTGMSPIAYLITYRLRIAEKMLTNTSIPIYEVCERVGFGDQVNFIRSFEKNYGETPTSFRKKYCLIK